MSQYKTQYNNQNNSGNSSTGGTANIVSNKKDGTILKVVLNNQNLVLKGFWDNKLNGWKLFPYYDKTKTNPSFNKPKPQYNQDRPSDFDDQLPSSEQEWSQGSATEFNPADYE